VLRVCQKIRYIKFPETYCNGNCRYLTLPLWWDMTRCRGIVRLTLFLILFLTVIRVRSLTGLKWWTYWRYFRKNLKCHFLQIELNNNDFSHASSEDDLLVEVVVNFSSSIFSHVQITYWKTRRVKWSWILWKKRVFNCICKTRRVPWYLHHL
jgi:hypothetical protein